MLLPSLFLVWKSFHLWKTLQSLWKSPKNPQKPVENFSKPHPFESSILPSLSLHSSLRHPDEIHILPGDAF